MCNCLKVTRDLGLVCWATIQTPIYCSIDQTIWFSSGKCLCPMLPFTPTMLWAKSQPQRISTRWITRWKLEYQRIREKLNWSVSSQTDKTLWLYWMSKLTLSGCSIFCDCWSAFFILFTHLPRCRSARVSTSFGSTPPPPWEVVQEFCSRFNPEQATYAPDRCRSNWSSFILLIRRISQ